MMRTNNRFWRQMLATGGLCTLVLAGLAVSGTPTSGLNASPLSRWFGRHACRARTCDSGDGLPIDEVGGTWYWLRSPDEEKRVVIGLYNRYCIRCHGVDGRGVWDMPDIPNFTNPRWQELRSDGQLARIILEGRGAVMPPFRGTFTLEEAWAMARYLRTFVLGSEVSRPDLSQPGKATKPTQE